MKANKNNTQNDVIKAVRRGNREAEMENRTGWVQKHKTFKSKKAYTRKAKHNNLNF